MITAQVGDLSSYTTKYSSPALTQKVFANMRREGNGFYRVKTSLFEGMLVPQQAAADVDDIVIDDVADDVDPTLPPLPIAQPSSPPQQQQPSQPTIISMDLLNNLLEMCTALTRRVENLEQDKIDQALEIIQLKKRVRKLEKKRKLKVSGLKRLRKGKIIANIYADEDITLKDVAAVAKEVEVEKNAETKEEMEEEDSRALKRVSESQAEKAAKKQKLDEEVPVVDYEIYTENNKPYYKIIRADGSQQLFLSFLSLLRNLDREDLEVLWQLVKERFASSKPKNFSDDFLLTTLTYMFEKPNVQAQVWKNKKIVHGLAKVKSQRLLESCRVHIITFITTQMILLVERRYPLTRFILDQMLNNVRLEVKEESEVSMELLRFVGNNKKKDSDQSSVWIHPPRSTQRSS
nr:hypothetical protein [Tanacetum cinerariifolium]